ncbi:hypothetical protein CPLU01_12387 [Colletotrichum plurivorum]|uniref:Uncharacterized protein n=1 Tax=Colletotrichum plurivorum TaxID=2175906 RepID=A0A8H6JYU9_9PEZI|nr:hypothetical protein CPLU01_12387 [Colletotrichum plurivorum]
MEGDIAPTKLAARSVSRSLGVGEGTSVSAAEPALLDDVLVPKGLLGQHATIRIVWIPGEAQHQPPCEADIDGGQGKLAAGMLHSKTKPAPAQESLESESCLTTTNIAQSQGLMPRVHTGPSTGLVKMQ